MAGIGDLVAYLGLDNKDFKKGLNGSKSLLSNFASGISSVVAPVAGVLAGVWGVSSAVSGAKEALAGQQKLAAVFEATGGAAGISAEEVASFADQMQGVTNFEGDATVAAAAMLGAFDNIKGDQFTGALEGAMNLSTVMGGDLESNVKLLGEALNDPEAGLKKLAKAGITFTAQQESQIKAMQASGDMIGAQEMLLGGLEDRFGGAAEAVADPWTILMNTLGDVGESIGGLLLPSINVVSEALTGLLGSVQDGIGWFAELGIEAAVVLSHIGGLLVLGVTQWELFFVQAGMSATHFFTDVIPAYLDWLGKNWSNVLFTMGDLAMTVFINIGQNIRNAWQVVLDFFSGNPVEFDWVPLTEGFVSAIDRLPDVPERVTTEFEQSLQRDIDGMSENLGESMDKQRAELTKKFSPLAQVGEVIPQDEQTQKAAANGKSELGIAFRGSQEASKIINEAMRGGKDTAADKTAENTEDIADETVAQTMLLKEIRDANKGGSNPVVVSFA